MEHFIDGTRYEIVPASIPRVYPVKGAGQSFKTRIHEPKNNKYGESSFMNTVFRGFKETLDLAAQFVDNRTGEKTELIQTDTPGIWELYLSNNFESDIIDQVMKNFCELKMVAFFDMDGEGGFVCYSAPGYEYVTACKFLSCLEHHEDDLYTYTHWPNEDCFEYSFNWWITGEQETLKYRFPFKTDWEKFDYLIKINDAMYAVKEQ